MKVNLTKKVQSNIVEKINKIFYSNEEVDYDTLCDFITYCEKQIGKTIPYKPQENVTLSLSEFENVVTKILLDFISNDKFKDDLFAWQKPLQGIKYESLNGVLYKDNKKHVCNCFNYLEYIYDYDKSLENIIVRNKKYKTNQTIDGKHYPKCDHLINMSKHKKIYDLDVDVNDLLDKLKLHYVVENVIHIENYIFQIKDMFIDYNVLEKHLIAMKQFKCNTMEIYDYDNMILLHSKNDNFCCTSIMYKTNITSFKAIQLLK